MTADGSRAILRGKSIWLRAFERDDLEDYWRCITDRDIAYWAGYTTPQSHDNVTEWYDQQVRGNHGRDGLWFVVSPLGSDDFAGTTWIWNRNFRLGGPASAEISIYIADPGRWGSGIGTDAINVTVDAGFGFWPLEKIWLYTSAENERSQRAFAKAGFTTDGTLRRIDLRRGKSGDAVVMSMLRAEWEGLDRTRAWDYTDDG